MSPARAADGSDLRADQVPVTLQPLLCPRTLRVMAGLLPEVDDLQSEADWAAHGNPPTKPAP